VRKQEPWAHGGLHTHGGHQLGKRGDARQERPMIEMPGGRAIKEGRRPLGRGLGACGEECTKVQLHLNYMLDNRTPGESLTGEHSRSSCASCRRTGC